MRRGSFAWCWSPTASEEVSSELPSAKISFFARGEREGFEFDAPWLMQIGRGAFRLQDFTETGVYTRLNSSARLRGGGCIFRPVVFSPLHSFDP
jgi:hypothetical protein